MDSFEESFAYCHHRVGATLQVAVAVDGSKVSKKALDLAVALANEKRHPDDATLDILHVETDPQAPAFLSPEHIEKECALRTTGPDLKVAAKFHALAKPLDESVEHVLAKAAEARDAAAHAIGWLLPSVGVQSVLARIAQTDMQAQLAYQDRIRAFHKRLRDFYYGYLFTDKPFGKADFDKAPKYEG